MTTALAEPYARPRDFLARMAGLGRPVLWSLAATSLVSTVAAVAAGGWAWHEARASADRAQRLRRPDRRRRGAVVGRVPGLGRVGARGRRSTSTSRSAGSATCARGPPDVETLKVQRRDVIWATDQRVYGPLQELDEEGRRGVPAVPRST